MIVVKSKIKILYWTAHGKDKMRFYGISEQRVRRILHSPKRIEEGIAPQTIAVMQESGSKKKPFELWVMVEETSSQRKIISVWRYPGITKPKSEIALNFFKNEFSEYSEGKE